MTIDTYAAIFHNLAVRPQDLRARKK